MGAAYIFRLDDITPGMDWDRFWALMQLFRRYGIKPLLGIVPDNRDHNLNRRPPHELFWDTMQDLAKSDEIDVAQHGYQHILVHRPNASLLGPAVGIRKEVSEFAGDPLIDQEFRISEGKNILAQRGLSTPYWIAPNHSFDKNTLQALRSNGFTAVSDGIGLFPYVEHGLLFVPQTSWRARWMPFGVHTICLHTNAITPLQIKELRLFLRRPYCFTRFSDVCREGTRYPTAAVTNTTYATLYRAAWAIKKRLSIRRHNQPRPVATPSPQRRALQSEPALPQP
jgi:predicted deacetylase